MLQSMGSQRVGHNGVTELRANSECIKYLNLWFEPNIHHLIWPRAQEIYLTFWSMNVITLA